VNDLIEYVRDCIGDDGSVYFVDLIIELVFQSTPDLSG